MKSISPKLIRILRRCLLATVLPAVVIALLMAGGLFWLESGFGQSWLQARVNQTISGTLRWDRLRFSPLGGRLELSGLRLDDPTGDPLASLDRLILELAWHPLLQGTLQINTIVLDAPTVNLQVTREGNLTLTQALMSPTRFQPSTESETSTGLPIDIAVRLLRLTRGQVNFASVPANLQASLADLDIIAGGRWSTQTATLKLSTGVLHLALPDLEAGLDRLELAASMDQGTIAPIRLTAAAGASQLTVTGKVQDVLTDPRIDLRLNVDLALAELLAALKPVLPVDGRLTGRLQGSLRLDGRLGNPRGVLTIDGSDVAAKNVRIGNLAAALRLDDGLLLVERLNVLNQRSVLTASGSIRLKEVATGKWLQDPPMQLDVTGDPLYIEDFTSLFKGRTALEARLAGTLRRPEGTVTLTGTNLDTGYQKLSGMQLQALLERERVRLDRLEITVAANESISATGWLGYDQSYQIDLKTDAIALQHIDPLYKTYPTAEGNVSLSLTGEGTLAHPQIGGKLAVTGVRISGNAVEDLHLTLNLEDRVARVSGHLNFDLSGSYHLDTRQFDLRAFFQDTALDPYTRIAGLPDIKGRFSGTLKARGTPDRSGEITAAADLTRLALTYQDTPLVQAERLQFSMANGQVRVPRNRLVLLSDGWLEISGEGGVEGTLNLEGAGVVPLQALEPFIEDLNNTQGNLNFVSHLGGTLATPDLLLEIALAEIGCSLLSLSTRLHDLNGRVLLTPDALRVDQLNGMLDTGTFELTGRLDLEAFKPKRLDARLTADALPLAVPDTLDVLLNADLRLSGTPDNSILRGTLTLIEGLYYKDVNLSPLQTLKHKPSPAAAAPRTYPYPFLENLALDVAVKHRNAFLVDNNLASLEIIPDLRIGGTLERSVVDGRIQVPSGTVTYYHRNFTVNKGVVDFVNPYRIEPLVNLESETSVRRWTICLKVSGTPENLKFKLASEPQETDQDILSLLLVGKTTSELIADEGGSSTSPKQMVAQLVVGSLVEEVKKTTGVDVLEVEVSGKDSNGEAADTQIKVTVGKELSRRLMIKYATEAQSGKVVHRTEAEYRLLEHFLLTVFQDNQGVFGGALSYRLEFR